MASSPKPGDPDFVPRYPPLDLALIRVRLGERRSYVGPSRAAVDADTDMMEALLREVDNLRLANALLKETIDQFRKRGC